MRRLAQEGVIFRSATAAAPWTTPSMMTVLTGLYPWSHHVRDHDFSLSPQVPLLSQRLKEAGYATAAIVPSATLGEDYGFARGFDLYVNGHYGHQEVTSPAMAGQALSWLDRQGGPFFCWIHLWDPHFNYLPPHPYDASFPSDFRPAENRYQLAELKNHESPLRLEEVRFLESQYKGEILFTDRYVGDLLDLLDRRDARRDTLVVLLGDHGEGFQEHGWLTHTMRVYEEMVHVPLILSWPGHLPQGLKIDVPVSLVDLQPTILDLLERPSPGDMMEGRSLKPLIEGMEKPKPEGAPAGEASQTSPSPIVSETVRQASFGSLREGDWKYILNFDSCRGELYELSADPAEKRNRVDAEPRRAAVLRSALLEFYRNRPLSSRIPVVHLENLRTPQFELLRSLGYLQTDRFGDRLVPIGRTDPLHCE